MKKLFIIGLAALTLSAFADPYYVNKNAAGNAATPSEVVFPSDPTATINIVAASWTCDSNNTALAFTTGAGAYTVAATNSGSTGVTNQLTTTNGLVAASIFVLEHGGVAYKGTGSSMNSNATYGAYIVLTSGGFGSTSSIGDSIYQMSSATSVPVGTSTNTGVNGYLSGLSLYAGNRGRPVRCVLTPANATNNLNNVVGHYE